MSAYLTLDFFAALQTYATRVANDGALSHQIHERTVDERQKLQFVSVVQDDMVRTGSLCGLFLRSDYRIYAVLFRITEQVGVRQDYGRVSHQVSFVRAD